MTFVNKLDREGRDPFDLLDEIEQALALDVTPASWPIGIGRDFLGTYDLFADAVLLFERGVHDPKLLRLLPKEALAKLCARRSIACRSCPRNRERRRFRPRCPMTPGGSNDAEQPGVSALGGFVCPSAEDASDRAQHRGDPEGLV